jgi:Mor family transcriptional regulator
MTLLERYMRHVENIKESQKVLRAELAELVVDDTLTRDERKFMNHLMDLIGYNNTCLSITESTVTDLKRKEKDKISNEEEA